MSGEKISPISMDSKKENKSWSTRFTSGNMTKSINVDKLDNTGYLVSINIYGTNKKGKYIDSNKKFYSEINPLEKEVSNPMDEIISQLLPNN